MKTCRKCGYTGEDFPHNRLICTPCRSAENKMYHHKRGKEVNGMRYFRNKLKREFDITVEDYEALMVKQNNVCAICEEPDPQGQRLAVDHNHKTGKVRGLLCGRCNKALGSFKEDPEIIEAAIAYLEKWNGKKV